MVIHITTIVRAAQMATMTKGWTETLFRNSLVILFIENFFILEVSEGFPFWNSTEMVQKYLIWPITGEPHAPALSRAGSSNGSWFLWAFLLIREQGSSQEILSGNRWYLRPLFLFNILLAPFLQRGGISPGHFLKFQDETTWTDPVYSSF